MLLSGCSVLLGNVRPVEETAPLSQQKASEATLAAPWLQISQKKDSSNAPSSFSTPEMHFQNQETGSTLAFTSGCRKSYRKTQPSLRKIAQQLGSGLINIQKREQIDIEVQGIPALRNTVTGMASGKEVTIHNVIFTREACVYDLTLVSLRRHFESDRGAFEKVLATLPLTR